MKKTIEALFQWAWLIIARVLGIITGLVMVPVAIPFRVAGVSGSDGRPIVNLPGWAWLWGNDFDGLQGDKRDMDGWQFVWSEQDGRRWYGFYLVHCWSPTRAFVVRFGFKIKPEHQGKMEPRKGLTFKINPFKAI